MERNKISRRDFLKFVGLGAGTLFAGNLLTNSSPVEARVQEDVAKGIDNRSHAKETTGVDNLDASVLEQEEIKQVIPEVNFSVVNIEDFKTQFPGEIFDPANPQGYDVNGCVRFSGDVKQCLEIDSSKEESFDMWFKSPYYSYYHDSANPGLNPKFLIVARALDGDVTKVSVAGKEILLNPEQCAVTDVEYQEFWEGSVFETKMRFTLCKNPDEETGGFLFNFHRLR